MQLKADENDSLNMIFTRINAIYHAIFVDISRHGITHNIVQ